MKNCTTKTENKLMMEQGVGRGWEGGGGGHLDQFCSAHELKYIAAHEPTDDGQPKEYPKKPTKVQRDVAPLLANVFWFDRALIGATNFLARSE